MAADTDEKAVVEPRENPWLTGTQLRDLFAIAITHGAGAITSNAQADFIWQQADLMIARREIVQPPI